VEDPSGQSIEAVRRIRDDIALRVTQLLANLDVGISEAHTHDDQGLLPNSSKDLRICIIHIAVAQEVRR
jgi:hypothetical protein